MEQDQGGLYGDFASDENYEPGNRNEEMTVNYGLVEVQLPGWQNGLLHSS